MQQETGESTPSNGKALAPQLPPPEPDLLDIVSTEAKSDEPGPTAMKSPVETYAESHDPFDLLSASKPDDSAQVQVQVDEPPVVSPQSFENGHATADLLMDGSGATELSVPTSSDIHKEVSVQMVPEKKEIDTAVDSASPVVATEPPAEAEQTKAVMSTTDVKSPPETETAVLLGTTTGTVSSIDKDDLQSQDKATVPNAVAPPAAASKEPESPEIALEAITSLDEVETTADTDTALQNVKPVESQSLPDQSSPMVGTGAESTTPQAFTPREAELDIVDDSADEIVPPPEGSGVVIDLTPVYSPVPEQAVVATTETLTSAPSETVSSPGESSPVNQTETPDETDASAAAAVPKPATESTVEVQSTDEPVAPTETLEATSPVEAAQPGAKIKATLPVPATAPMNDLAPSATDMKRETPPEESSDQDADITTAENSVTATAALQTKVDTLEAQLEQAQRLIETLHQDKEGTLQEPEDNSLLMELQSSLQQQMGLKAEAENQVRLVNDRIQKLEATNKEQKTELEQFADLGTNLEKQMSSKAEAENKARLAEQKVQQLESSAAEQTETVDKVQRELVTLREERASQVQEVQKIRDQRDEQERKEMALTNRLNAAKKKEATKANLAEQFEEDSKSLEQELQDAKQELEEVKAAKAKMETEFRETHTMAQERMISAERALAEERRLNEERKKKMKNFVESKAEELRQAKADNDSLQSEATQSGRALMDLNNRWKQLHAQWVQSQTRNRELQRDLNRIKKDSENLHKVGDTLEMKLSRSANETEEHKNKRLAAKHELMTVLRTLEAEREVSSKLRDSIKFTFTPKALSQQQLLKESLDDFEAQLLKLSQRLGKPLPQSSNAGGVPMNDFSETSAAGSEGGGADGATGDASRSEADMNRLIAKLEYETQHVSQCIMALTGGIERMHLLLNASGQRTCYTALAEILGTGTVATAGVTREETTSITGARRLGSIQSRSHSYGQVAGTSGH